MKYCNSNKLEKIKIEKNNYYVILDFDKTITSQDSLDSWMAIIDFEVYGKKCEEEIKKINAKYAPIEMDYEMDYGIKKQCMVEWYEASMDVLYRYNVTYPKLVNTLQKNKPLQFRKGAKEFLTKLKENNVPVIILSAGIGNVIEEFLTIHHCYYDNIYIISNFLEFAENKMQKFTKEIIHSMNKKLKGNLPVIWKDKIKRKQYAVLCGDIIEDIDMVEKEDLSKTLTIGFLNQQWKENVKFYKEKYDIVLTQEEANFNEVEKILQLGKEEK